MRLHLKWIVPLVVPFVLVPVLLWVLTAILRLPMFDGPRGENSLTKYGLSLVGMLLIGAIVAVPIVGLVLAIRNGALVRRASRRSRGRYTKKERPAATAQEGSWLVAQILMDQLRDGQVPESRAECPWQVERMPGEVFNLRGVVGFARFHGADVSWSHPGLIVWGTSTYASLLMAAHAVGRRRTQSRAVQLAAPQWRWWVGGVDVIVTSHRLLCLLNGAWVPMWFGGITAMSLDLMRAWTFTAEFDIGDPLRVQSELAPIIAVWAVHQRYGVDGLRNHPALDPLRSSQMAPVYLGA